MDKAFPIVELIVELLKKIINTQQKTVSAKKVNTRVFSLIPTFSMSHLRTLNS